MIMEKNRGNPDFAFMYGGPGMDYYMWRKYCVYMRWSEEQINDQVRSYMAHAFQRPPVAVAPPPPQQQQQHFAPDPYQHHMQAPIPQPRLPIAGDRDHAIRSALMQLNGSKDSIFGAMHTILGNVDASHDSARAVATMIRTHVEVYFFFMFAWNRHRLKLLLFAASQFALVLIPNRFRDACLRFILSLNCCLMM
jgi:hypothetical protein